MSGFLTGPVRAGAGGLVRTGRPTVPGPRARWLRPEVLLLGCGLILLPWSVLLASLPGGPPWAVLDLAESAALSAAAVQLRRGRRPFGPAVLAGVLLVTDAGCDVATATGRSELLVALLMAVCAELPLAAVCWSVAFLADGRGPASAAGRWRRFRPLRERAATPAPVGELPIGFPTEGVSVQNVHLTERSAQGAVPGPPASRSYAGVSSRLLIAAASAGPGCPADAGKFCPGPGPSAAPGVGGCGRPTRAPGAVLATRPRPRTGARAALPRPGRSHPVPSAGARAAASARRDPGVRRQPSPERQNRYGEGARDSPAGGGPVRVAALRPGTERPEGTVRGAEVPDVPPRA
ncbi:hypothetical protein Kpho01_11280 [Kitasatospora phosalacinea]|uniref:Uncharacterized protein n=1 Tax=Kitasatospora phosalacinea TaxID=2065 RepID=A0A9W6PDV3_9ACTN|nr:hypothetical protein Kpho01_11280 [Kitasatospora phosalacinea]